MTHLGHRRYLYQCYSNNLFLGGRGVGKGGCFDSAVGRGGASSARLCCRGREFNSHGGS